MSDGAETRRWRRVQKSLKVLTENTKQRQALSNDGWHLFLKNLKKETRAVEKLFKFLEAWGESKNAESRDSVNARLPNFCHNIEDIKVHHANGKREEAKKEGEPAIETDFTQQLEQKKGSSTKQAGTIS